MDMDELLLLQSQKNSVLRDLERAGFDPAEFEWEASRGHGDSAIVSVLRFKSSDYFFSFDSLEGFDYAVYSPGERRLTESQRTYEWSEQIAAFQQWLKWLAREVKEVDLWSEYPSGGAPGAIAAIPLGSDRPFSQEEQVQVRAAIQEIRTYIGSRQLSDTDRVEFAEERLEYLAALAEKQGRVAWAHTALGILFTVAAGAAFAPEAARDFLGFAGEVLRRLIAAPNVLP